MDFAFSVLRFGLGALGFGFKSWTLDFTLELFGFRIVHLGFCTLGFGFEFWTSGFGLRTLNFELDFGLWTLVFGIQVKVSA